MRIPDLLTAAERRLILLLGMLTVLTSMARGLSCVDPEIEAWLSDSSTVRGTVAPPMQSPSTPAVEPDSTGQRPISATETRPRGVVDPNTATHAELVALPGIGPALAGRIIAEREKNGSFATPEDLLRVRGIGPATLSRIRSRITVSKP